MKAAQRLRNTLVFQRVVPVLSTLLHRLHEGLRWHVMVMLMVKLFRACTVVHVDVYRSPPIDGIWHPHEKGS